MLKHFTRSLAHRLLNDNISFLAGGVAFYALLALFPAMTALVSLVGIFTKATLLHEQLHLAQALFPPDVYKLLYDQLLALTQKSNSSLSLTAIVSLIMALMSATRGTKAMVAALNALFRVRESRSWWQKQILAVGMTAGSLFTLLLGLLLIVATPLVAKLLSPEIVALIQMPLLLIRWGLLAGVMFVAVMMAFTFGPSQHRDGYRFLFVVIGACVATIVWILAAFGGSWLVQQIPQLHATFGSLSAMIALMLWIVISAYAVLVGAAVTATLEEITNASTAEARD